MALSREEILHLAALARIHVSDEEIVQLGERLESVLGYVNRLSAIDTTDVPDRENFLDVSVLRADEAVPSVGEDLERLVTLFPDKLGQLLRVPGVFEKPKS